MKKQIRLPNGRVQLRFSNSGFTLVELTIAVVIIAILVGVGLTIFSAAQRNARDTQRKSEIIAIAKAIQSARDPSRTNFTYSYCNIRNDFPSYPPSPSQPLPDDPQWNGIQTVAGGSNQRYCMGLRNTNPASGCSAQQLVVPTPPANNWSTRCPPNGGCTLWYPVWVPAGTMGGGATAGVNCSSPGGVLNNSGNGVPVWILCSIQEGSSAPFCKTNQT